MVNEYGEALDRNGYAPSLISDRHECVLCGRTTGKLDRHEIWGGALRQKSKNFGCWCYLCHEPCHLTEVHKNADTRRSLRRVCQPLAMERYGWTTDEFIKRFGRNYL